jgi:hypothetical protein
LATAPQPPDHVDPSGAEPGLDRREHLLEVIAVAILATATVVTAWSGYQATSWNGVQSRDYVSASGLRVQSSEAYTRAGQNVLFDSQVFSQWLNAYAAGNAALATIYERRFRPEFRPAFEAWLATDPLHNPAAPPGPLYMPQYVSADAQRSDDLAKQADTMFASGQQATQTSNSYVLNTVFLASALFLAGISGRFTWRRARIAILATSGLALALGVVNLLRLPVQ